MVVLKTLGAFFKTKVRRGTDMGAMRDMEMKTNLVGRVENQAFHPDREVYWPIFEAVKNSLDAIEESGKDSGRVVIEIERDEGQLTIDGQSLPRVSKRVMNIVISDDGIGFDPANLESFNELDSRKKRHWGGKGLGRLYFLKAFNEVLVDSYYGLDGQPKTHVQFKFSLPKGITEISESLASAKINSQSVIRLIDYKLNCERFIRKKHLLTLKNDLIRHFMSYLMFHQDIVIVIKDGDETETITKADLPDRVESKFDLHGKVFSVHHMKLKTTDPAGHHFYLCAHDRVVGSAYDVDPAIGVPSKGTKIEGIDGNSFYYAGYVVSSVLDEAVNAERTGFNLIERVSSANTLDLDSVAISIPLIKKRCDESVNEFLCLEIQQLKRTKEDRIKEVFAKELPGLSYLQEFNAEQIEKIPVDATEEEILRDAALMHLKNRSSTEKDAEELIARININDESIEQIQKQCAEKLEKLGRVHAADLAQYITGRASVLHLFSKLLEKGESGKFEYEKTLHSLVFPMRRDESKSHHAISVINHNLWLFDEKFAFYEYIASDLQLKGHKPLEAASDSIDRPDVSIYFFSDDYASAVFDSVVIIEFKRPGRTDVGSSQEEDPVGQVFGYIDEIRERMEDFKGREIPTRDNTKFFCYVVCDTETKHIRKTIVANYTLNETLDPGGYFGQFPKRNAYVELISYRKLLADAYKRNLAFFRKLQLPENLLKQSFII